ncbi:hypothetical protein ACP4OV_009138 [Aristida adscensionis]
MAAAAAFLLFLLKAGLVPGSVAAAATDAGGGCESGSSPSMRGAANQLAAAAAAAASTCTTNSTDVSASSLSRAARSLCDAPLLSAQLMKLCPVDRDVAGSLCCAAVLMTIDVQQDCLCSVIDDAEFISRSDISVAQLWRWYQGCGGRRRSIPEDENRCQPGSPPPPPAKPEAPSAWPVGLCIAVGVLCTGTVIAIIFVALLLRQVLL